MKEEFESTALSRTLANTETLQLAEIHSLDAFYTPIEQRFERITRLGRRALSMPVVAITAVSLETQWFKSVIGWTVGELPLNDSLCSRTIAKNNPIVIPNLLADMRYATHPLVVKAPKFRFYAGFPLRNAKGSVIGTLCMMDVKPRELKAADQQLLEDLAALAERELLTIDLHNAQTELISKLSVARRQAMLDPLTKTWNRRGGMMLLGASLRRAAEQKKSIAVCVADVNDFKRVNDTYGHSTGDRALCAVAKELLASVRASDGVCRFGGDEFFIVIVGVDEQDVQAIAKRAQRRIQQNVIAVHDGRRATIGISVGVRYAAPGTDISAEQLLADADKDLYEGKMAQSLRVDDTGLLAV